MVHVRRRQLSNKGSSGHARDLQLGVCKRSQPQTEDEADVGCGERTTGVRTDLSS